MTNILIYTLKHHIYTSPLQGGGWGTAISSDSGLPYSGPREDDIVDSSIISGSDVSEEWYEVRHDDGGSHDEELDYHFLSVKELKRLCRARGVDVMAKRPKKKALVALLEEQDTQRSYRSGELDDIGVRQLRELCNKGLCCMFRELLLYTVVAIIHTKWCTRKL